MLRVVYNPVKFTERLNPNIYVNYFISANIENLKIHVHGVVSFFVLTLCAVRTEGEYKGQAK